MNRRVFSKLSESFQFGGVSEWPMEHAWKACKRESVSWVRIPPPPFLFLLLLAEILDRRLEPLVDANGWFPIEEFFCLVELGPAHLGIVGGQRHVDDF